MQNQRDLTSVFSGKRVVVSGGAGFIGSHLSGTLAELGAKIIVIDNLQAGSEHNIAHIHSNLQFINKDIRCMDSWSALADTPPDFVFHLAGNASVPLSSERPLFDFELNAHGTSVALEAMRTLFPRCRIILASSGAVYGEPGNDAIKETHELRPISPYGHSKLVAEQLCRMYSTQYDCDAVIARIFNSYGPRLPRFVVLDFLRKLRTNPTVLEVLGDGKQTRDFTFVSDTVQGLLLVAAHGKRGEAYNIASGISSSVTELATTLLELVGRKDTTTLLYTGASWQGDAQFWRVSIEKAEALGYAPKVFLHEGLGHVLEWFNKT